MSVLNELKRRNVYRVAAAYAIVGWMTTQVISVFAPALRLPDWVVSLVALVAVIGFPIALLLSWLYELTPTGLRRTDDVPVEQSIAHATAQKLNYVIIGALAAALLFVTVDAYVLRGDVTATAAAPTSSAPAATAAPEPQVARQLLPNSVAVLPFANLSPNPNDAYFAQGIHEEVLNQLAKVGALNVIARTSVLRYADGQTPLPDIARELNVQTVMEGSVRYAGDEVRITAQLIDPQTGAHLWSDAYQHSLDDIFAIQADIAMSIANALRAEFSIEEQREIERPLTSSPEAYALYLQARTGPSADLSERLKLLDRALALDPSFAAVYGRKALIYSALLTNSTAGNAVRTDERTEVERLLRESAQRALALDPSELQGRAALGAVDVQRWYWSTVRAPSAQQLTTLFQPAAVWVHAWKGDVAGVLPASERWAAIDPNINAPFLNLGVLYAYAGDRDASDRMLRRGLEISPRSALTLAFVVYNAVASGNTQGALGELARLEQILGDDPPIVFLPEIAYAYRRLGRDDDARRVFARIEAAARDRDIGTGGWALAYLGIGDEERALEQLEAAAAKVRNHESDAGYIGLMNLRMNFLADPLITTPQFAQVLARLQGD